MKRYKNYFGVILAMMAAFIMPNVYAATTLDEYYAELAPNDILATSKIARVENGDVAAAILNYYLEDYITEDFYAHITTCEDDGVTCELAVTDSTDYTNTQKYPITVSYSEYDEDIAKDVASFWKDYNTGPVYNISDLDVVNLQVTTGSKIDISDPKTNLGTYFKFSKEYRETAGVSNYDLYLRPGYGEDAPLLFWGRGMFLVSYNGVVYYGFEEGSLGSENIIYIEEDTAATTEAFVAAAQARVDEYFGKDVVKITYADKLTTSTSEDIALYTQLYDSTKMLDAYYYVEYNNVKTPFLIAKDESKMIEKSTASTKDVTTEIIVSTTSPIVPLDAKIEVSPVTSDDEVYKDFTSKIEVSEAIVYDINLFAESAGKYITEVKDGTFEVRIPIPDSLKDKELAAYYLGDEIEKITVEVEGNTAIFTTTHFSTYAIAEDKEIKAPAETPGNNPGTSDSILPYVGLGMVMLSTMLGTALYLGKQY